VTSYPTALFGYSLDLFAPVINLGVAKGWNLGVDTHRWRGVSMRPQILLGLLIVPLGLAAVTGLVK
jgi:hypothetical protein